MRQTISGATMCCFTAAAAPGLFARLFQRPIHVSWTRIFARMREPGVQALAYSMNLDAAASVAMVLPLPVAIGSGEAALQFIDLSAHSRMFFELQELFEFQPVAAARGGFQVAEQPRQTLVVHRVGSFVASYVPTRADFDRLDPRFRLPSALFDAVPHYADYGFAVFQLEPGKSTVHPMAFTFKSRAATQIFFPTVHVHDGRFHQRALFDHALYYQTPRCREQPTTVPVGSFEGDAVAWRPAGRDYAGLVVPGQPMVRRTLHGRFPNQDTWIAA